MSEFAFTYIDKEGNKRSGIVESASRNEVMKILADKGQVVVQVTPVKKRLEFVRTSGENLLLFTQELGSMLKAGIPIKRTLDILAADVTEPALRQVAIGLSNGLNEGRPLSEMMAKYPGVFSNLYISMVTAGETGGDLPKILLRLAKYIENAETLRKKVKAQLYYPAIVVCFAALVITFLFLFAIPILNDVYSSFSAQLPLFTRIFIGIGLFLNHNILFILGALLILVLFGVQFFRTEKGRLWWDNFKLKAPLIGPLIQRLSISRFARTLSTLYGGGVPLIPCMELVAGSMGNLVMEKAVRSSIKSLQEGMSITKALERTNVFTPMTISMIAAGEEGGTLDTMLEELGSFYEVQVDITMKALAGLVEPIIIIGVGLMVGFMILSMALPFMTIFTIVK